MARPSGEAGVSDETIILIAYEKMCEALNELIAECYTEGGRHMVAPSPKTIARLRGLLPPRYSMAYRPKEKTE